jgi:hypothetical protein
MAHQSLVRGVVRFALVGVAGFADLVDQYTRFALLDHVNHFIRQ